MAFPTLTALPDALASVPETQNSGSPSYLLVLVGALVVILLIAAFWWGSRRAARRRRTTAGPAAPGARPGRDTGTPPQDRTDR